VVVFLKAKRAARARSHRGRSQHIALSWNKKITNLNFSSVN